MRRATGGVVMVTLLIMAVGCDSRSGPAPEPTVTTAATTTPTADDATADLVGVWGRTTDTMEVVIRFLPDGRYRSVEIYTPLEAGGVYVLQRVEDGLAEITGGRMRLVGRTATLKRTAADDTAGDYEKSTPPRTGTYDWALDGDELHLTEGDGKGAVFTRQQ
jgi:hypothetical protein